MARSGSGTDRCHNGCCKPKYRKPHRLYACNEWRTHWGRLGSKSHESPQIGEKCERSQDKGTRQLSGILPSSRREVTLLFSGTRNSGLPEYTCGKACFDIPKERGPAIEEVRCGEQIQSHLSLLLRRWHAEGEERSGHLEVWFLSTFSRTGTGPWTRKCTS